MEHNLYNTKYNVVYDKIRPSITHNFLSDKEIKEIINDIFLGRKKIEIKYKKYEPRMALDGGNDGLDLIKKVIYKSKTILKKSSWLALEIGYGQYYKVSQILKKQN